MRKVARKNGLRRSAIAILRRYCRLKTDVKIIIYSRDLAGVSVTLWQRVTLFCTFDIASQRTKVKNAPAEGSRVELSVIHLIHSLDYPPNLNPSPTKKSRFK